MSQTSSSPDHQPSVGGKRLPARVWWLPYLVGWVVFLVGEFDLTTAGFADSKKPIEWLLHADTEAIVYLSLLLAAPLAWRLTGKWPLSRPNAAFLSGLIGSRRLALFRPAAFSVLVGGVSIAASMMVGARFDDLPPAYHDEYSYLFQARTFLAGRVAYRSHQGARLFDQMHVLNDGRFASRYFPGAGLWMAPFLAAGHVYWGHWLAGSLCAVLMFWVGRDLVGDAGGLIAGLLTALSPGMALFSNLLLAHHPTLVGLGIFILGALRMKKCASVGWAFTSGLGLTFAMLCRPMTAAGVALPFGIDMAWRVWNGGIRTPARWDPAGRRRLVALAALGAPLIAGATGLFFYDRAITGDGWTTPYSRYTDLYSPRHVYGFNNVVRGERRPASRLFENYDKWAENLTPALAVANAATRLTASWKWTLGLIPLGMSLGAGAVLRRRLPREAWLVLAGIASLHAVHVPYWFVGMEDHHYVFESGPLWAVWIAVVSIEAARAWRDVDRSGLAWWWGAVVAITVVMNFAICGGTWSAPLEQGINRVAFARHKHGQFDALVTRQARPPALVLVEADPADRHIDYVNNSPALSGPVLIGRYLPAVEPISEVRRLFPDRNLYLYRIRENDWRQLE